MCEKSANIPRFDIFCYKFLNIFKRKKGQKFDDCDTNQKKNKKNIISQHIFFTETQKNSITKANRS